VPDLVITGGAGFLGARLARDLLATGTLDVAGDGRQPVRRLTLIDQVPVPADLRDDPRVSQVTGDLGALLDPGAAGPGPRAARDAITTAGVIFHLAAAVSGECEADFDLGIRANLRATEALLACCRTAGTAPVLVFSSSLAVFGASPDHPLPAVIGDQTLPNPQTSYGVQKVIGEQLLADYTRRGFLRGRAIRLMTVCVRPGRPNAAASGFMSSIIREPLAGQHATCPVDPSTAVALASPARTITGLRCAAGTADAAWGGRSAVTLPALTVTVAEMAAALERAAGPAAAALIDWAPDPGVAAIVASWPARVHSERAARLGLAPDPDFGSIIQMHLAETRGAAPADRQ